jgi:hypothetical protein
MNKQLPKVQLTVSSIQADLGSGLTWLKRDDMGYGSIQEKYEALDSQIMTIKKHPALVNLQTINKIFVIVDDTKVVEPVPVQEKETKPIMAALTGFSGIDFSGIDRITVPELVVSVSEEEKSGADAFANL